MVECRFMDYIFPLDSSLFDTQCKKPVSLLFGLDKIKRITMIEEDMNHNLFRLYVEDLDPLYAEKTSPNRHFNFGYYKEWLQSLNNQQAKCLQEGLEKYQQTIGKISFEIQNTNIYHMALLKSKMIQNYEGIREKVWIKQLNINTKTWIKTRYY